MTLPLDLLSELKDFICKPVEAGIYFICGSHDEAPISAFHFSGP